MKRKIYISLLFLVFAVSMNAQSWPRFFWNQIQEADTIGAIAVAGYDGTGVWSDSLRWQQGFLRIGIDTAATRAYARSLIGMGVSGSGTTGILPIWSSGSGLGNSAIRASGRYYGIGTSTSPTPVSGWNGYGLEISDNTNNLPWFKMSNTTNDFGISIGSYVYNIGTLPYRYYQSGTFLSQLDNTNGLQLQAARTATALDTLVNGLPLAFTTQYYNGGSPASSTVTMEATRTGEATASGRNLTILSNTDFAIKVGNRMGVGTIIPEFTLDVNSTDAIRLPIGTTSQRPTGVEGSLRYSSTFETLEWHNGYDWSQPVSGSGTINYIPHWTSVTGFGDSQILHSGRYYGIGTSTSPTPVSGWNGYGLEISDNTNNLPWFKMSTSARLFEMALSSNSIMFRSDNSFQFRTSTGFEHNFYVDNIEKLRVNSTAVMLPDTELATVGSTTKSSQPLVFRTSYYSGSGQYDDINLTGVRQGVANDEHYLYLTNSDFVVNGNHQIGVGVLNPSYSIDIEGSARLLNFVFDTDQDTTGLDGNVLTFNSSSGEIGLAASSGSSLNGILDVSNDNGTIPTSMSLKITDSLEFGTSAYPSKFHIDSMGVIISRMPTEDNSTVITTGDNVDWSNIRGRSVIIGTNLIGDTGTKANYDGNVLIGPGTYTTGGNNNYFNTIVGYNAYSSGDNPQNTVFGANANTQGVSTSTALGYAASVTASNALAVGSNSVASASKAIAIGYSSTADEAGEITLGDETGQTKLNAGNYTFNIDQSVGSAQDNYVKGYNDTSGEIELRPSSLSTRGQLIETVLTSLGTLSTSYAHVKSLTSQNLSNFTATDSTLTYTGSETILVEINYSGSVFFDVSTSGTYNTSFLPYVNGTQKLEAISTVQMTSDGAEDWIFPFSGTTWVELSTSDVISLRRKGSSSLTASLSNLSLTIKAL